MLQFQGEEVGGLMIILDYQDRRPLYEQIVEKLRTLILRGVLPPGERLPSVRQLALDLAINPNTIQRAYMELEQLGLIYPVKGRGNFVADARRLQEKAREDYENELRSVVRRGMDMGLCEETIVSIVRECCGAAEGSGGAAPGEKPAEGGDLT